MDTLDPVEHLNARAKAANVAMCDVCDRAGVARSTPSRWNSDKNGATIATLRKLNDALSEIIAERAEAPPAVAA
jgi:transcriptional regulator with XRE-family HTH domain